MYGMGDIIEVGVDVGRREECMEVGVDVWRN